MAQFYFLVNALPTLAWGQPPPGGIEHFLDQWANELEPIRFDLGRILFYNDLQNACLLFQAGARGEVATDVSGPPFFSPSLHPPELLEQWIRDKLENLPPFFQGYLEKYREASERATHFEELLIAYFNDLEQSGSPFLARQGEFEFTLRTILVALRARAAGLDLDRTLTGRPEIVETILLNRSSTDLGLKLLFPAIGELLDLFEQEPGRRENLLDHFRFKFLEQFGVGDPFGEEVILAYFSRVLILEKWHKLDEVGGLQTIRHIVSGERAR